MRGEFVFRLHLHSLVAQLLGDLQLLQSGKKTSFISHCRRRVVVGMTSFPVRKNYNARLRPADYSCDLQAIDPCVLDASIGNVECLTPSDTHKPSSFAGLAFTVRSRSARSHFATRQIEDPRTLALLRHLEQRAAAGLLHVVPVCGDGENIQLSDVS